jgi:hypothetical protein
MKTIYTTLITWLALLSLVAVAGTDPSNTFTLGDGTVSNKTFRAQTGQANKPNIRWNSSTQKWEFSDDGVTYSEFGTGSGGGSAGGVVLNLNGGFEEGTGEWIASGGTFATTGTAANVGFGTLSGNWDPSAAQTLSNSAVTVPAGLFGKICSMSWYYKGGDSNYTAQVYDGTNIIAQSSAFTTQTDYSAKQVMYFNCPSTGTIQARFATGANAAAIFIDDVRLGQEQLFSVGGNGFVGSAYILGTASCSFDFSTATVQGATPDADCPGPTIESQGDGPSVLQTTDFNLPKFAVNNVPPGQYEVTFTFRSDQAAPQDSRWAISDGTNTFGSASVAGSGVGSSITLQAVYSYATTGNRFFEVFGGINSGTLTLNTLNPAFQRLHFSMKRIGGPANDAITIDKSGWRIDANIGGANPSLGTVNVATYTEITNAGLDMVLAPGSAQAEIPCSSTNPSTGLTCAAGNESVGIVFTPPSAGTYEVCGQLMAGSQSTSGTGNFALQWIETPNNAQTFTQEGGTKYGWRHETPGGVSSQQIFPVNNCSTFTFNDTSKRTLRLMYELVMSGTLDSSNLFLDRAATVGQRDMKITVRRKVEFADAIKLNVNDIFANPSRVELQLGNGSGATRTSIRRWQNVIENVGTDITYTDSATNGAEFLINVSGNYAISWTARFSGGVDLCLTRNQVTDFTAACNGVTSFSTIVFASGTTSGGASTETVSKTYYFTAGTIIRALAVGTDDASNWHNRFSIVRVR